MGFFSEIFHVKRAQDLEKQGRYDEAIAHVLKSGGHRFLNFEKAAQILKGAKKYREAIDYYKKAAADRGGVSSIFFDIVECYEILRDYSEAIDFRYKAPPPYSNPDLIYKTYKRYRVLEPSFRLSRSRSKDLYLDICRSGFSGFQYFSKEDQRTVVEWIQEECLTQEIIDALKAEGKSYWHVEEIFGEEASSRVFGDEIPKRSRALGMRQMGNYWEAGRLYEEIGDFSEAADSYKSGLYQNNPKVIVPAVRCFAKAGQNADLKDFLKRARERYWFSGLDEELIKLLAQETLPAEALEIIFDFSRSGNIQQKDAEKLAEFWRQMLRYDNAANVMQRAGFWVEAIWMLLKGGHVRDASAFLERLRSGEVQQKRDSPWRHEVEMIEQYNEQLLQQGRLEEATILMEALAIWYEQAKMPERAAKIYDLMGQSGKSDTAQANGAKQKPQDAAKPKSDSAEDVKEDNFDQLVCPQCGAEIKPHWTVCPKCDADLQERKCRNCGEPLELDWKRCPVCRAVVEI
jgi:tetratricopeptide (TPR) repeat protein